MPYLMILYTGEIAIQFYWCYFVVSAEWQITFLYRLLNYNTNLQVKDLYRPLLSTAKTLCSVGLHLKHDSIFSLSPEHDIKLYLNPEII